MNRNLCLATAALACTLLLQGCGFVAGAAVGGTAAYVMKDKGYDVQSPVTRDEDEGVNLRLPVTREPQTTR